MISNGLLNKSKKEVRFMQNQTRKEFSHMIIASSYLINSIITVFNQFNQCFVHSSNL